MRRILIGIQAGRDLNEAWEYIAADNLAAADKLCQQVEQAISMLAEIAGHRPRTRRCERPALAILERAAVCDRLSLYTSNDHDRANSTRSEGLSANLQVALQMSVTQ
jgi:plasmid stabilization system protein ParE